MHIYFSGIGGVAMGPLARIARDLGHSVTGSDKMSSRYTKSVEDEGIAVHIGQRPEQIAEAHELEPIDWLVYSSALPADHPELAFAKQHNIRASKRDEFINDFLQNTGLNMIAVAGTHGKSNTTGMLVWVLQQLGMPVSYSIGTNISFGKNGQYQAGSQFFVYEADEFDRNFLKFKPFGSIITAVDYDHVETYPSVEEYKAAFRQFAQQSDTITLWQKSAEYLGLEVGPYHILDEELNAYRLRALTLLGEHTRHNACLVVELLQLLMPQFDEEQIIAALNSFPGTERRMEEIAPNFYSDYAHHPVEIKASLQALSELKKPIVAVYQPHQNMRQHQIMHEYGDSFALADEVYWLPTYLSRENTSYPILMPEDLIRRLQDPSKAKVADLNMELIEAIKTALAEGNVVVAMSAGDLDQWLRDHFQMPSVVSSPPPES